jgi:hypothetical protein
MLYIIVLADTFFISGSEIAVRVVAEIALRDEQPTNLVNTISGMHNTSSRGSDVI